MRRRRLCVFTRLLRNENLAAKEQETRGHSSWLMTKYCHGLFCWSSEAAGQVLENGHKFLGRKWFLRANGLCCWYTSYFYIFKVKIWRHRFFRMRESRNRLKWKFGGGLWPQWTSFDRNDDKTTKMQAIFNRILLIKSWTCTGLQYNKEMFYRWVERQWII